MKIITALLALLLLAPCSLCLQVREDDEVICSIPSYSFKFYSGNIKSMQDIFRPPTKTYIISSSPHRMTPRRTPSYSGSQVTLGSRPYSHATMRTGLSLWSMEWAISLSMTSPGTRMPVCFSLSSPLGLASPIRQANPTKMFLLRTQSMQFNFSSRSILPFITKSCIWVVGAMVLSILHTWPSKSFSTIFWGWGTSISKES